MDIQNILPVQGTQVSQGPQDNVRPEDRVLLDADYDLDVQILETPKQPPNSPPPTNSCSGRYTCGECGGDYISIPDAN